MIENSGDVFHNDAMTYIPHDLMTAAANENLAPIRQAQIVLAELYQLRREMLKEDVASMSFRRRRQREEALRRFHAAEAALLAVLPLA